MLKLKGLTFQPKSISDPMERKSASILGRFGAYVRRDSRKLLKKSKKKAVSQPGDPPVAHSEALRLIFFDVDRPRLSVIIGPIRLGGKIGLATRSMEEGGDMTFLGKRHGKRVTVRTTVKARPFMRPAFDAKKPKLPEMWRNAITN